MFLEQTQKVAIRDVIVALRKYRFSITLMIVSLVCMIGYSHLNFAIENQIYNLNKQKSLLTAENFQLKREISELSNPERINTYAKQELGMINIKYEQVKFIQAK